MAGQAQLLREYFVKLGFKSDLVDWRKFENNLGNTGKQIFHFSKGAIGAIVAVETAAAAFAYKMRAFSFKAELANTSIKNLNAMGFAAKQVGVDVGTMQDALHSLAQGIRLDPGKVALLEALGVPVKGRDVSDVAIDLVKALKQMPEMIGAQYAQMFGMDPDTFHMLATHTDEFSKAMEHNKSIMEEYGVDAEQAAKVAKEYAGALDDMEERLKALVVIAGTKALPVFKELNSLFIEQTKNLAQAMEGSVEAMNKAYANTGPVQWLLNKVGISKSISDWATQVGKDMGVGVSGQVGGGKIGVQNFGPNTGLPPVRSPEAARAVGLKPGRRATATSFDAGKAPAGGTEASRRWFMMDSLESDFGLPKGMLKKLIQTESGGNDRAVSPAGAQGPAQLMPSTAQQLGVTNAFDFNQAVPAAAKYLGGLMKKYNNDPALVLMAYNWGEGNVDSFVKTGHGIQSSRNPTGAIPAETQAYVQKITGAPIGQQRAGGNATYNVQFNTTVNGAGDPRAVGKMVTDGQSNMAKNLLRDTRGVE